MKFGPPDKKQSQMMLLGCGPSGAGESFVGALDDYTTGLLGAYSAARRLLTSYTGALIRVRRSSDDAEDDIGYDAAGDLDTAALAAFVGANSAYLVTRYHQNGGTNLTQATASKQPRIVNAGTVDEIVTGVPSPYFDGSDDSEGLADGSLDTWRSIHTVGFYDGATFGGYAGMVGDDIQAGGGHTLIGEAGLASFYALDPTAVPSGAYYLNGTLSAGLAAPMQTRGVVALESAAGYSARSHPFLGADRQIAGRYWLGPIAEHILYDDVDSSRRAAITANQLSYYA